MADVTIFASIPDEVLERMDYQDVLAAMRLAFSFVTTREAPFTVQIHDFEEVED